MDSRCHHKHFPIPLSVDLGQNHGLDVHSHIHDNRRKDERKNAGRAERFLWKLAVLEPEAEMQRLFGFKYLYLLTGLSQEAR
jgi:hypothetical protein